MISPSNDPFPNPRPADSSRREHGPSEFRPLDPRSLRIGLVISELEVGGAEKNFVNLAIGLNRLGHQVFVHSLDPRPAANREQLVAQLEQATIPVRFGQKSWTGWPNRAQINHLAACFRQDAIEVAASFLVRANLATVLAGRRYRSNSPNGSRQFPVVLGFRQAEPRFLVRSIEQWCRKRASATVCVSRQVAQHYVGPLPPLAPNKLHTNRTGQVLVIPNGVGIPQPPVCVPPVLLDCFGPRAQTKPGNSLPVLLFVGRLTEQKGLDQLLSLTPAILRQLPEFRLVIVGQGPLEHSLRTQAARLECHDRIHFLGWQANPLDFIQASRIVLLHSRWEGQPNAILEAMSLAKPFVAIETHGLADIFHPELVRSAPSQPTTQLDPQNPSNHVDLTLAHQSQVVASGNPQAFIDSVVALARAPEMAQNIGIWNQTHVQNHFSTDRFVSAYEQVFLKLANACQHPL
jgi:glycosyltransferase involved in cell wall biosynthesis